MVAHTNKIQFHLPPLSKGESIDQSYSESKGSTVVIGHLEIRTRFAKNVRYITRLLQANKHVLSLGL